MDQLILQHEQLGQAIAAIKEAEKLKAEKQQLITTLANRDSTIKGQADTIKSQADTIRLSQEEQKALTLEVEQLNNTIRLLKEQLEKPVPVAPVVPVPEKPPIVIKESYEPIVAERGMTIKNAKIYNSNGSAVILKTGELVTFENCEFGFTEHGIKNHDGNIPSNYKVHNSKAVSLGPMNGTGSDGNPNKSDPNRFLSTNNIKNAVITNCETESMSFMKTAGDFRGDASKGEGLYIQFCFARNIQGRNKISGFVKANFLQIADVYNGLPADIGFNRIENKYGKTHVEDNINVYNARGRKDKPIWIHGNLIEGAFYDPTREFDKSKGQLWNSGGGIITDGDASDYNRATAYVLAEDNTVVGVLNYGLGMGAGNNNTFRNNVVIVAGVTDTGKRYEDMGHNVSGMWANPQSSRYAPMDNNLFEGNTVGIMWHGTNQFNVSIMKGAVQRGNNFLDKVTKADEVKAILEWEHQHKDIKIGLLN